MKDSLLPKITRPFVSSFIPRKLKILFVATEAAPFAQAGGLGSVMRALPMALKKLGQDVRLMTPRYGTIDSQKYHLETELRGLKVPTDQPGSYPYLICNVRKYVGPDTVPTYFLENMEYFEKRANVYGYNDDHIRWALLCRGVLKFLKNSSWQPEVIVACDWQTGLISNYLQATYKQDPLLSKIKTVFAIHNLRYQGMCDFKFIAENESDSGKTPIPHFFDPQLTKLNWMLRGIAYSDAIVTVSPSYAQEILTPEYGEGLHETLQENKDKIYGILNGIDYAHYSPQKSPHVPVHYSPESIERKQKNKPYLQKELGLTQDKNAFVIGMVGRLARQKGFDILGEILEPLLKNLNIQFISIGDGDPRYKEMIQQIKEKFPGQVGYYLEFSYHLPHLVWAGADAILMPSKFEPCGIVQMEAMRYGCIPIARKTGGLGDTITDFNPKTGQGNGFLFEEYDSWALFSTIIRAKAYLEQPELRRKIIRNAMRQDLSWKKSARKYLQLFYKVKDN